VVSPMAGSLLVAMCLTWVLLLRPGFLGGPASYIMVSGVSMEPTLRSGDLVVVRKQESYTTGDLVAFDVKGGVVIHRIVGGSAEEGFVVQGDNKRRPDSWRPRAEQVRGSMWFRAPGGGRAIAFLRQPLVLAALLAGLGTFSLWRVLWPPEPKRRPLDGRMVPAKRRRSMSARGRRSRV